MRKYAGALRILLCGAALLLCAPGLVKADVGPKESLIIHMKNPPQELYYLDLLVPADKVPKTDTSAQNPPPLDAVAKAGLFSLVGEGWVPAYTDQWIFRWGDIIGKEGPGGTRTHWFGYRSVPQLFRIVVSTQSGKVVVSAPVQRFAMQSSLTFDLATGKVTAPPVWLSYIVQFLGTLLPTLLIEGVILRLFGFSWQDNKRVFFAVNLVTQLLLTATLGTLLITQGSLASMILLLPAEAVIIVVESIAYAFLLQGQSKGRRVGYGLAANIASAAFGLFSQPFLFIAVSWVLGGF